MIQSKRQSKASLDSIARERRIDFEIEMLRDLLGWIAHNPTDSDRRIHARLYLILLGDIPAMRMCRSRFDVGPVQDEQWFIEQLGPFPGNRMDEAVLSNGRTLREEMLIEVGGAMHRKARERDEPPTRRRPRFWVRLRNRPPRGWTPDTSSGDEPPVGYE